MRKKQGFTLIELLVVIAIIGLLSTLAVVALNNARQKSRDAKRVADVKQIQTALELFYNDQNTYPGDGGSALTLGTGDGACLDDDNGFIATCTGGTVYMGQVPSNPTPTTDGDCTASRAYVYKTVNAGDSNNVSYRITYCVGADTGGVTAGVNTACESGVSGCSPP